MYFSEIKVDNDGNVICPICDEKLPSDSNWEKHVEIERKFLIKSIESIKEQKHQNPENVSASASASASMNSNRSKQKRESELQRIRSNQQKRLTLKTVNPLSTSRNIENFDSTTSRSTSADKNFCKGCERHHDYLIISSTLDEPRCYECFRKFRQQTTFLPLSFTESLENDSSQQHLHHHQQQQQQQQLTPPSNHSVDGLLGGAGTSSLRKRPSSNCSSNDSIKSSSGNNNEQKRFKISEI
uniref:Uncharacterized protein n=1 Tax=Panagrolaimus superbus TaxID=310955 RepID=A0A914YFE9_9BILA